MALHIKAVHDKSKDYICQHCDKAFSESLKLAVHDKIKEKTCAKAFRDSFSLAIHNKAVHDYLKDNTPPNSSNSTSAPLDLSYKPNNSKIEEEIYSGYKSEAT